MPARRGAKRNKGDCTADKPSKKAKQSGLKVDKECPVAGSAWIYTNPENNAPFACVLNQTNISQNNNKFFILQVVTNGKKYWSWIRWGRVGYKGQTSLTDCGKDVGKAINIFEKKFSDKTKNKWGEEFEKHPGKYDLVMTEVGVEEDEDEVDAAPTQPEVKVENVESKLEKAVQDLIRLICDVKAMEMVANELEFDTKRNPLGKISQDQIKAGYESLNKIADLLKSPGCNPRQLRDVSSEFYTRIPHCFGMRVPPPIQSLDVLKQKIKLLEVLGDIKLGMDIMKEEVTAKANVHHIDRYYSNLNCDLKPLKPETEDFSMVEQYIQSTHAGTHNMYTMDVQEVFECNKNQDYVGQKVGSRKLLFHGSRMSNWAGILSQGLRIAPPEAPVTGYMFGKGVYFADMSSKSANYCFANRSNPYGLLLLCEVALGDSNDLLDADYEASDLPKGKHSVKGLGRVIPDPANETTMEDGVVVPMGPGIDVKTKQDRVLNYNEYIVYDTRQIRLRYIAKIKFEFL